MAIGKVSFESVFHRASEFEELFEFVFRQVPVAKSVTWIVSDMKKPGCRTGGVASYHPIVTLVFVGVSCGNGTYPYIDHHSVPEVDGAVGGTHIESWKEEVLLTLLHEARHLYQFAHETFSTEESIPAEIDAERFAKRGLAKWRREQRIPASKMAA